ncbi:MAG: glycoside hydrolase family 127 protein [Candidatus Hydrogenedentes bacterium]|nr:glycoside hydrolase family 127 protein [Candidatus Hydrogenedentota bacterium]
MLGLLLYCEDTACEPALDACRKAADLLFETFGPGGPTLTCDGSGGQMNMAVCHSAMLLYEKTGVPRYLDLAKYIVHDAWNEEGAGKYLDSALAGVPVHQFPQHRWEALHDYQALPQLYWLTGDEKYRRAYEHIFRTGLAGDRHNTGGVTSGEGFCGSPYNQGAIETCCTVAWIAMSVDVLRMTGDSRVADEIEWSTLNSALGAVPYSGRVCAYNVPMDGARTFGVELPWQSPKAGPDLNCCAVNAYRPMGMLAEWALMDGAEGLTLNFYGPSDLRGHLASGNAVVLSQDTRYPVDGHVTIRVQPERTETFALRLRIPEWSKKSEVRVCGQTIKAEAGTYLRIERAWSAGDMIEIDFDFSPRFWIGEQECANKTSVYRGPLLYAYDARYNELNPDQLPKLDWASVHFEDAAWDGPIEPWALAALKDAKGATYRVCDFSSAGQTGNQYKSWLP